MLFAGVDIEPGYHFSKREVITAEAIKQFATLCQDFNPLHHDEAFAQTTRFGKLIACGPHIVSLFTALTATHFSTIQPMVGLEFSYKFLAAVRAGDEVNMSWRVTALERSDKMRGMIVKLEGDVSNEQRVYITSVGAVLLLDAL